jgi:hypothetical protein
VLVVTTTVRMVNRVWRYGKLSKIVRDNSHRANRRTHSHTASLGPAVPLDAVLVVRTAHRRSAKDASQICGANETDRPALSKGLSIRPPPATIPIVALAPALTVFFAPDGRRIRLLPVSTSWPMTVA